MLQTLWKVLRDVGEMTDEVSSLRLDDLYSNGSEEPDVSNDSFGRRFWSRFGVPILIDFGGSKEWKVGSRLPPRGNGDSCIMIEGIGRGDIASMIIGISSSVIMSRRDVVYRGPDQFLRSGPRMNRSVEKLFAG